MSQHEMLYFEALENCFRLKFKNIITYIYSGNNIDGIEMKHTPEFK